jgi:hypothetical protein
MAKLTLQKKIMLFVLLCVPAALARIAYYTDIFYLQAHHSAFANGKAVEGVMIHTGLMVHSPEGKVIWLDPRDSQLERRGDHFFSKERLSYEYNSTVNVEGLAIQYWVTYQDGSTSVSSVFIVNLRESHQYYEGCTEDLSDCMRIGTIARMEANFTISQDGRETQADRITLYH